MTKKSLRSTLCAAMLAAGTALGCIGNAGAAVYSGEWDPPYGPFYPDLWFAGRVTVSVPDACLNGAPIVGGQWIGDNYACSGGGMSLLTAQVDLSNTANHTSVLETLTYAPPPPVTDPVLGVFVQYNAATGRNEVVGLDTNPFGPQQSHIAEAGFDSFYLEFVSGQMPTLTTITRIGIQDVTSGAQIYGLECNFPRCRSAFGDVQFTLVPEPGTLALLAGALGVGWAARRRRA